MEESEWHLGQFKKTTELTKKYEVKCPQGSSWFNMDDCLVERGFQAALDFLTEVGYIASTPER